MWIELFTSRTLKQPCFYAATCHSCDELNKLENQSFCFWYILITDVPHIADRYVTLSVRILLFQLHI